MKPNFVHSKDERNPAVRECPKCKNWYSLLCTLNEYGGRRNYNHCPGHKGICTCHLGKN